MLTEDVQLCLEIENFVQGTVGKAMSAILKA